MLTVCPGVPVSLDCSFKAVSEGFLHYNITFSFVIKEKDEIFSPKSIFILLCWLTFSSVTISQTVEIFIFECSQVGSCVFLTSIPLIF